MKYLSHYIQEDQTKALKEFGAFFAFNKQQFEEQRDKTIPADQYVCLGSGTVVPLENAIKFQKAMNDAYKKGIQKDLAENGIQKIIRRELENHEAFLSWDGYLTVVNNLADYSISAEQIKDVYNKIRNVSRNIQSRRK